MRTVRTWRRKYLSLFFTRYLGVDFPKMCVTLVRDS